MSTVFFFGKRIEVDYVEEIGQRRLLVEELRKRCHNLVINTFPLGGNIDVRTFFEGTFRSGAKDNGLLDFMKREENTDYFLQIPGLQTEIHSPALPSKRGDWANKTGK